MSNVIGSLNPRYGLFGDTVNTASRMESNSYSGKIHCSEASAKLLKEQAPDLPLTKRGKVNVKGKGSMTTYWVGEGLLQEEMDGSISRTYDDHPVVAFKEINSPMRLKKTKATTLPPTRLCMDGSLQPATQPKILKPATIGVGGAEAPVVIARLRLSWCDLDHRLHLCRRRIVKLSFQKSPNSNLLLSMSTSGRCHSRAGGC